MKHWYALALCLAVTAVGAQTTYRWIDKDGKVHYSGLPPAPSEATKVEQRRSSLLGTDADPAASYTLRQAMADYPVTVYTQAECGDPCKMGKDLLTRRGIPYTEKVIATEADLVPLRAVFGDDKPTVPVMQVGKRTIKGYQSSEWDNLLDAAGYPKAATAKPAAKPAAPAAAAER